MLHQLNNTFSFSVGYNLFNGGTWITSGRLADNANVVNGQWAARAVTGDPNIPLYNTVKHGLLDSIFEVYSDYGHDMPEAFSLLNYPAELNWFLKVKLNMSDEEAYFT